MLYSQVFYKKLSKSVEPYRQLSLRFLADVEHNAPLPTTTILRLKLHNEFFYSFPPPSIPFAVKDTCLCFHLNVVERSLFVSALSPLEHKPLGGAAAMITNPWLSELRFALNAQLLGGRSFLTDETGLCRVCHCWRHVATNTKGLRSQSRLHHGEVKLLVWRYEVSTSWILWVVIAWWLLVSHQHATEVALWWFSSSTRTMFCSRRARKCSGRLSLGPAFTNTISKKVKTHITIYASVL